jgi:rubrerythrin
MSTAENLQAAFAGESQANRKYLAYAQKAESDGFPQVAKLFRAAAAAETVHAHSHLRAMGGIKTTEENLKVALEGEAYEFQSMYPEFLAAAQQEGVKPAEMTFKNAMPVEEVHHGLYAEALKAVAGGQDLPARRIQVCSICGHTLYGEAPDRCPICGASHERFNEVD